MMKNNQATRTLVVYHNADMDGITSGLLAINLMKLITNNISITYNDEFLWDIVGYNYGKNSDEDAWLNLIDDSDKLMYNNYIFIDCTPPLSWLKMCIPYIEQDLLTINIFDHHNQVYTEIKELLVANEMQPSENFRYFFDINYSGAYIFWDSICNNNNWIFETYGFLFKLNQETSGFFKNKVSEGSRIKQTILETISRDICNRDVLDFVSIVSTWDTWHWYEKYKATGNINPLEFNEGFMRLYKLKCNSSLDLFYDLMYKSGDNIDTLSTRAIKEIEDIGTTLVKFKNDEANLSKHELVTFAGVNIVAINKHANFYDTEVAKMKYLRENIHIDAVLYYTPSVINQTFNISFRSISEIHHFGSIVKLLTDGNGGGHKNSAGGQMKIVDFLQRLEPLKIETN